jgi:hypothetical protein
MVEVSGGAALTSATRPCWLGVASTKTACGRSRAARASVGTPAQRLVADGETVLDVPAKLSARARVFATGQGRKTDPVDARSVAVVAVRTDGLRHVEVDDTTVALRLLVDRRDQLGRARTETVSRLHHLLAERAHCCVSVEPRETSKQRTRPSTTAISAANPSSHTVTAAGVRTRGFPRSVRCVA